MDMLVPLEAPWKQQLPLAAFRSKPQCILLYIFIYACIVLYIYIYICMIIYHNIIYIYINISMYIYIYTHRMGHELLYGR